MVRCRYRDMRRETSHEIKSMWYNLGEFHVVCDLFECSEINTQ